MTDPKTYATRAHAGQTYGAKPYTVHLAAVVEIVRTVDPSPEAEAVAWLHDALEDTDATEAGIAADFGALVSAAVALVTDPEGYPNRKTRKAALHASLASLSVSEPSHRLALLVKAADRLANVRAAAVDSSSKLKMYRKEHAAFRASSHREGLCDVVWRELDSICIPRE